MTANIPIHTFKDMGIDEVMAQIFHWTEPPRYNINEIHSHDFYQLLVFKKGGGKHTIDYGETTISSNSIHSVAKGSVHLSKRAKQSDGFTIAFSSLYLSQLQQFDSAINYTDFYNQSSVLKFNNTEFLELSFLFNELHNNENNRSYFLNILAAILSKIIILKKKDMSILKSDVLVHRFMSFMNINFLDKNLVEKFIETESISKINLARKIKQSTNYTLGHLIKEKIHLEAKKLLYSTNLSVKEITFQLQFEDESYFCKVFKQQEGISPNEFRKKCG